MGRGFLSNLSVLASTHTFHTPVAFAVVSTPWVLHSTLQLLAMDASARTTMKGAAKCDKHCELQNSVNQQNFERILRLRDIPEGMSASESPPYPARQARLGYWAWLCVSAAKC